MPSRGSSNTGHVLFAKYGLASRGYCSSFIILNCEGEDLMDDRRTDHEYVPYFDVISLIGADHLIRSLLGHYDLNICVPVRRKISMEPVYEHPKTGVDLVVDLVPCIWIQIQLTFRFDTYPSKCDKNCHAFLIQHLFTETGISQNPISIQAVYG